MEVRKLLILAAALALVGFGCQRSQPPKTNPGEIDRNQILSEARKNGLIMDEEEIARMADPSVLLTVKGTSPSDLASAIKTDVTGWKSAALADVTGGGSFGLAFANQKNEKTTVIAKMGNLPTLGEEETFTAWLVQRGREMKVVRLGETTLVGDQFVVVFQTTEDLSAYDFFVLTHAQSHILEGSFR